MVLLQIAVINYCNKIIVFVCKGPTNTFQGMLNKYTDVPVDWKRNDKKRFAGRFRVILLNEAGALAALSTIIAQQAGNISYMQITKRTSDFFTLFLDVEVVNLAQLKSIITVVRSSQFVESVERIMIQ